MADNITIDNGTLTDFTALTDDCTTGHAQIVKLAIATDGSATLIPADASNGIDVDVTRVSGDVTVVQGTAANLNATVTASNLDIRDLTATDVVTVTGGAGQTADVKVTLDSETVAIASIAAGDNNIGNVDVVTQPARAHTTDSIKVGDGTAFIDIDTAPTDGETNGGKRLLHTEAWLWGYNGSTWDRLRSDTTNGLDVDVTRLPALVAGTANIGDVDVLTVPAPLSTSGGGTEATALRVTLASDSTGLVSIDDNNSSITVDNGGTFAVQATLQASTNTTEVVGDVAHSAGASGNPIMVAGAAQNGDDTAPPNRVDAEGDATRLATDWDGAVYVRPHGPQIWSYHANGSAALTDASVHAAPGSGLSLYVTSITVSSGAATAMNVFFEEGASIVLGPYYLEAVNGRGLHLTFPTPKKITANTALTVTTSAAIAHSVDVIGFTAQG